MIHPQRQVDLIVSVDFAKEKIDVRPTVIYDVDEFQKRVIIAQTNPPILKSMVGRNVEATFLTRVNPGEDPKRVGYKTKIMGLLPKYLLRQGGQEQALAIGFPRKGLEETSVRLHYRVFPSQNHQMSVSIDNESSGHKSGRSFPGWDADQLCTGGREFQKGQKLSLVLKGRGQGRRPRGNGGPRLQRRELPGLLCGDQVRPGGAPGHGPHPADGEPDNAPGAQGQVRSGREKPLAHPKLAPSLPVLEYLP